MLPKIATEKQKLVYEYGLKRPYSIFAMDPRLGKSMVAISIQQKLKNNCLIICPSYLAPNWKKEVGKWAHKDTQTTLFRKGKDIYEPCDSDFVIISYDLVQKAEHLFEWADMIVIDECHHLKSLAAKRTQFIHRCVYENSIKRLHLLSGTILKNRVQEFYSPLALMYYRPRVEKSKNGTTDFLNKYPDEITFADHFAYRQQYDVRITGKGGYIHTVPVIKWEGLRNVSELKQALKGRYIRVKADEKDLPPIVYKDILISDSNNQALLDAFNSYFNGEGNDSVKPDIKAQAALEKVPFTIKYIEDLLLNVKCVLVYSDHVKPIEAIAKHFKVEAITGKMSGNKRSKLAADFQAGNGRIICATIGALKEGQDLFRSKDLVLNDPAWVSGDVKQVINRMRGLGKKESRTVHRILGSPQDEKIYEALTFKQEIIEKAT